MTRLAHTDADGADDFWACNRKKAYPSEDIAKLGVASIRETNPGAEVRAYACRRCGLWHVGATPLGERRLVAFGDDAASPRSRPRPPRRRSYGDSSVRRPRVHTRPRRDDDYE